MSDKRITPIGDPVEEGTERRRRRSSAYQAEEGRLAPFEAIARVVIMRRLELDINQRELAERMGTSHSAISRIESGQHRTSLETLRRLADALELRLVVGFERGPADAPQRDLIAV